jgi:hypothetical protein
MRGVLAIVVPLALPTVLYVIYMTLARRRAVASGTSTEPMEMPWSWLIAAGGILAIITFTAMYLLEDVNRGEYHPAEIIDGEIRPGYFDNDRPSGSD